jgi:hypothetical protein
MAKQFIGVDPHKLSATIEVVDHSEKVLATGQFDTDRAGYAAMRNHVATWPERVWAVEGSNGAGRPLAQRLLADGEQVVDVPAKLAARARLFDTGHNRKTDAHAVAVVAVRTQNLTVLAYDVELEALRMFVDRREELTRTRGPDRQPPATPWRDESSPARGLLSRASPPFRGDPKGVTHSTRQSGLDLVEPLGHARMRSSRQGNPPSMRPLTERPHRPTQTVAPGCTGRAARSRANRAAQRSPSRSGGRPGAARPLRPRPATRDDPRPAYAY